VLTEYRSEIRDSTISTLLERVRKQNLNEYLIALRLERIRQFKGAEVRFDFPVTALVGPNGGGKTTILLAAACVYKGSEPRVLFRKSRVGDDAMDDWVLEYELISKGANPKGTIKASVTFKGNQWQRPLDYSRQVKPIGIVRTIPASDNPSFALRNRLSIHGKLKNGHQSISENPIDNLDGIRQEAERILGKSLKDFRLVEVVFKTVRESGGRRKRIIDSREEVDENKQLITYRFVDTPRQTRTLTAQQRIYIGSDGANAYSEFSFGAGEASIIHLVTDVEALPDGSLLLIDEIENGLHPLAVRRLVEYLISAADRKRLQVIFTTHSDYALAPLPSEAIWAALDGRVQQGKLSIEILRAVSGRIDKELAIFVEDEFAKDWVEGMIRDKLAERFEQIGVYALNGDGVAVGVHQSHSIDPSVSFKSICIVDGDSKQGVDDTKGIFRLPGEMPELTVFNEVVRNLENNLAVLTAACHVPLEKQETVRNAIAEVSYANRDSHLLFNQVGQRLSLIPEKTISGAFLTIWISEHQEEVERVATHIRNAFDAKKP
jgi:AAA15 family ATPase/GTPase